MTATPEPRKPWRDRETNGIIDLHHSDGRFDLAEVQRGGVIAVFHKRTEGEDLLDPRFDAVMNEVERLGMLGGAYHFGTSTANGKTQAEFFLRSVGPRAQRLALMLDWETNPSKDPRFNDMTLENAALFVERIKELTGRHPFIYSFTSYFGEHLRAPNASLSKCPLWQAQYGERPTRLPHGFSEFVLWQYTSGFAGPHDQTRYPRTTRGFDRPQQDRSVFEGGGEAELRDQWLRFGLTPRS